MARDSGYQMKGIVYADRSAALAIADRKGSGKLRHINIRMLWIQENQARGEITLRKVSCVMNPADRFTKYLQVGRLSDLSRRIGQHAEQGRATTALEVQGTTCNTDT